MCKLTVACAVGERKTRRLTFLCREGEGVTYAGGFLKYSNGGAENEHDYGNIYRILRQRDQ